jgi:hypothetical protein
MFFATMFDKKVIHQNGSWFMRETPVPQDPGRDEDPSGVPAGPGDHPALGSPDWRPVPQSPEWDEAYLAARADDEYPGDLDEYQDPDNAPPAGLDDAELAALIAEARQNGREITTDQARAAEAWARFGHTATVAAVEAVAAGRRGPGMPGSAESLPAEHASTAAGFASGKPLDTAPGCAVLGSFLEDAAGDDDRVAGASDDELLGVICGWDRAEANASARKHAAVAELIRRRPGPGGWDEFAGREPGAVLAADQRVTAWAKELRRAGLQGGMDALRARAYLDLLLGTDSRPLASNRGATHGPDATQGPDGDGGTGPGGSEERPPGLGGPGPHEPRTPAPAGPLAGVIPPGGSRFTVTSTDQPGPPGGYGTWRFSTGIPGQPDLLIQIGPLPTRECDHRYEARGHDPGVMLRHLAQVRHATCTGPGCRRPSTRADFEHNTPYAAGGRTCLCNGNPKCRFDHRLKQDPRWKVEALPGGNVRWTTPSGRQCTTEPTRYPI